MGQFWLRLSLNFEGVLQHRRGSLVKRPGKGMAERIFLASLKLLKVNHIMGEQVFIFKGQTHIVQAGIIGTNGNVHTGVKAAIEHQLQLLNVIEGARFQICCGDTLPGIVVAAPQQVTIRGSAAEFESHGQFALSGAITRDSSLLSSRRDAPSS